jgi:hypothetical protein
VVSQDFFESQTNMNASSSNIAAKLQDAIDIVDFNQLSEPIAGIGMTATIDDNKNISVNANVQFISKADDGRFYLGLYLVEDKLVHSQANQGNNAVPQICAKKQFITKYFWRKFCQWSGCQRCNLHGTGQSEQRFRKQRKFKNCRYHLEQKQ